MPIFLFYCLDLGGGSRQKRFEFGHELVTEDLGKKERREMSQRLCGSNDVKRGKRRL